MGLKCIRILLIIILFQTSSWAQPGRPNFPLELSKQTTDTQRLNVYRKIFGYFRDKNNDSVIFYLEQGIREFERFDYALGRAALSGMIASAYGDGGRPKDAEAAAQRAWDYYTSVKDEGGVAKCHNVMGVIDGKKGDFPGAIKHFLAALPYFEKVKDTFNIVNTYIKLATAFDLGGQKERGLFYNLKGLDIAQKTRQTANIAYFYNNIGAIYGSQHKYDLALLYFKKTLALAERMGITDANISPLMNIGNIYTEKGEFAEGIAYYKKALRIARETGIKDQENKVLHSLGIAESLQKQETAKPLNEAMEMAMETGNKGLQVSIMRDLANVAHGLGNYEEEVIWLRKERELSDSLFGMEKAKEIANLQSQYELNKTNAELALQKRSAVRHQQQKDAIIIIASFLAVTLVTLGLFFMRGARLNKRLKAREAELEKANIIKDRLFAIIGHDLRGPIASIPALLNIYKGEDAEEETKQFILNGLEENAEALLETLEKLLNWGNLQIKGNAINRTVVSLNETADHIVRLLMVTASNKNITIVNTLPASLNVFVDENHIKFVLRNLVSNAVKFTRSGGTVQISGARYTTDGHYVISVKDDGVGIDKDKLADIFEPYNTSTKGTAAETGTSIGLMLCREFIQQNGGEIWVDSEKDKGSTFYFTICAATAERALQEQTADQVS